MNSEEIRVISELSGVEEGEIYFLNFAYDISTTKACSGVLSRDENGTIWHGRNLDFEFFR